MAISYEVKHTQYDTTISLPGIYLREMQIYSQLLKTGNNSQPKCPKMGIWINDGSLHNGLLLSNEKEQIMNTCNNLDESQKAYAERNQSQKVK